MLVGDANVLTNATAGTIDLAGNGSELYGYNNGSGPGVVVNNGTIDANLTSGTATIDTPLTTSLTNVKMAAGTETVSIDNGGTLSGSLTAPSGTIFDLDGGTFALNSATFSGAGLTELTTAATLTGTNTINSLFSFSGTTTGAGTLTLTGQSTVSGGTFNSTGTTTSSGALTVTGTSSGVFGPFTTAAR